MDSAFILFLPSGSRIWDRSRGGTGSFDDPSGEFDSTFIFITLNRVYCDH